MAPPEKDFSSVRPRTPSSGRGSSVPAPLSRRQDESRQQVRQPARYQATVSDPTSPRVTRAIGEGDNLKHGSRNQANQQNSNPAFPAFNSGDAIPTAGQQIFTHSTNGPQPGYQYFPGRPTGPGAVYPSSSQPGYNYPNVQNYFISPSTYSPNFAIPPHSTNAMSGTDYTHRTPPCYGVHFQPQVPDTTNGPYVHTYVPRHDAGGVYTANGCPVAVSAPNVCFMHPQPVFPHSLPMPFVQQVQLVQPAPTVYYPQAIYSAGVAVPLQPGQPAYNMAPVGVPPMVMQQPVPAGTMLPVGTVPMAGGPMMGGPVLVQGGPQIAPGNPPLPIMPGQPLPTAMNTAGGMWPPEPASGLGATAGEIQAQHSSMAADPENEINQPQDFKPADENPGRMYWCREVDGNWTMRNRFTIDALEDTRWYVADDGVFYAVRLPN